MASGKADELKGRVREAAGTLTGDKKLKRRGQAEQVVGRIQQKMEKVIDKVKDVVGLGRIAERGFHGWESGGPIGGSNADRCREHPCNPRLIAVGGAGMQARCARPCPIISRSSAGP